MEKTYIETIFEVRIYTKHVNVGISYKLLQICINTYEPNILIFKALQVAGFPLKLAPFSHVRINCFQISVDLFIQYL